MRELKKENYKTHVERVMKRCGVVVGGWVGGRGVDAR